MNTIDKATPGKWISNCAGEIFVDIDGEDIRIGHFQGCESDAKAVCLLINNFRKYVQHANPEDVVYRLLKRAEIRRQIPNRKSVQEGKSDRIADLLEEAANEIIRLRGSISPDFNNTFIPFDFCADKNLSIGTVIDKSQATGRITELAPMSFYKKG